MLSRSVAATQFAAPITLVSNYSQESLDVFYRRHIQAHAARRLPLCLGRRAVRLLAGRGPGQFGSGAAPAKHRNRLGHLPAQPENLAHGRSGGRIASGVYFRTSLYNYQKVRAQVHYQPLPSLSISADFTLLNNQNPLAGNQLRLLVVARVALVLLVAPRQQDFRHPGHLFALRSEIQHRVSGARGSVAASFALSRQRPYRHGAHRSHWPHGKRFTPKLAAGGSFFISSGSLPTSYYQPQAKLWVPLGKHTSWFSEWRYYGYGEAFNLYEGFRTHLVTTGVRFTPMSGHFCSWSPRSRRTPPPLRPIRRVASGCLKRWPAFSATA
jgi:hypothetical protein